MKKTVSIVLGFIILIIILINLPSMIAHMKKYSFDHNKQFSIETKVISYKELREMYYQQMKLAQKLEGTIKYSLVAKEIRKGYDAVTYDVYFLEDRPQIKVKIELPITKYKDSNMTINFISGTGKILEIYEDGKWKAFSKKITPEIINNNE
ncbi:hypothetical protein [Heyndrickxia oleronia]|uniref:DUF3888 domain-containing protein n=1 Tax=Heyndrickxia oleronia TaxID=38875 RepID=A0AAW6SYM7_9BACI|nr:hypothetical protein [Heyndrickxia oleronia]MDH5162555.1 hypothetical protein [Heyndrickxia oleronia]